jgi:hypothetical protein
MAAPAFTQVLPTVVLINGNTACFVPSMQFTLQQTASNVLSEIVTLSVLNQSVQSSYSIVGGQASGVISLNLSSLANTTSTTSATPDVSASLVQGQAYQLQNPGLVILHLSDTTPFSATITIAGQSITVPVATSYSGGGVYQACFAFNANTATTVTFTSSSSTTTASLYEFYTPQSSWFATATLSWVDKLQFGFTNSQMASPYTIQALVPLNLTPPVQVSSTALSVSYR